MSWRTVVISNRCKLDLSMGYMVVRGEETRRIFIDEIAVLMIENPAVSMTGCLLEELTNKKVRIIFCDSKRSPYGELAPYIGSHDSTRKLKRQMAWTEGRRGLIWSYIVREKIYNQSKILLENDHEREADMLINYANEMEFADKTNREGHAAKVYFNALFGKDFSRGKECPKNAALNYGYGLILSAFNREVTLCGYITQLGIHHDNVFNHYNLSSDLMEPFRPFVDRIVLSEDPVKFEHEEKLPLVSMLSSPVMFAGEEQTLLNAIKLYTKRTLDAMSSDEDDPSLDFPEL